MRMFRTAAMALLFAMLPGCAVLSSESRPISADSSNASVSGAYLQGRFAAQAFNIPKAGNAFEEVARRTPGPQGSRTAFGYALAGGDFEEAERQARLIVAQRSVGGMLSPDEASIQADLPILTLASAAMREGAFEEAAELLRPPLQSSLGQSLSVLLRSAAVFETDGMDGAARVLTEQEPGGFRGLVPLQAAFLYQLAGDTRSAEAAFRQALGAPRNEIAALGFARLMESLGRTDDAEAIYRTFVQDAGLYTRAGRMGLVRLGKLDGEPRAFRQRAKKEPPVVENATELFALALEGFAWLGFEQAISVQNNQPGAEELRRSSLIIPLGLANLARAVDPGREASHYLAALVFGVYDTPEVAIAAAQEIKPESWAYSYGQIEIATAEVDGDERDKGIDTLKRAIRGDGIAAPQWALQLHLFLAADKRYAESDRYATDAIEAAERLGVLPSSLWRYYFSRGAMRVEAGLWDSGRDDLEYALELAPDEPLVLNHLGYSYVERGENLERAFGMIERALDIDPDNGAIVDSLGWAHFQRGNYDQAVPLLERAVGLEPADAVITDHLGDAYYMVGRDREAIYEWRRVLDLDDATDELKADARAKLAGDFSDAPTLARRGPMAP